MQNTEGSEGAASHISQDEVEEEVRNALSKAIIAVAV